MPSRHHIKANQVAANLSRKCEQMGNYETGKCDVIIKQPISVLRNVRSKSISLYMEMKTTNLHVSIDLHMWARQKKGITIDIFYVRKTR